MRHQADKSLFRRTCLTLTMTKLSISGNLFSKNRQLVSDMVAVGVANDYSRAGDAVVVLLRWSGYQ
jgi:hypothetical protein